MKTVKNIMTKNDECYTPKFVIDYFGSFDYDPATTKEKAEEFNIANYDTIETNGLNQDWSVYNRIWINPPFTLKKEFLAKAVDTVKKADNEVYILFPCDFLTSKAFHDITKDVGGIIYLPRGRINFENQNKKSSPAFGSVIFKISNEKDIVIKRIVI